MPAMPPTSALPVLRTLRRVTFVMHSSLDDALGRSDAGLISLSLSRLRGSRHAHVVARATHRLDDHLLAFPRFQHQWRFRREQREFFAGQPTSFPIVAAMPSPTCIVSARPPMKHAAHTGPSHAAW